MDHQIIDTWAQVGVTPLRASSDREGQGRPLGFGLSRLQVKQLAEQHKGRFGFQVSVFNIKPMAAVVGRDIRVIRPLGRGPDLEPATGGGMRPIEYTPGFRRGDGHQSVGLMRLRGFHSLGEVIQQAGDGAGADRPLRLFHGKEIRTQIKILDLPVELEQLIDTLDISLIFRIIRDQPYEKTGGASPVRCTDFDELSPL